MATVRARCDICGDVDLGTNDLTVRYCSDTGQGSYLFSCPGCSLTTARETEKAIVDMLVDAGVRLTVWRLPAELREPRPSGPPITHDDIVEFHRILNSDEDWLQHLYPAT